jgi:Ni/Fe-hydrogenase subunit HybB-like protein
MSGHSLLHEPVGGKLWTRPFKILVFIAAVGGVVMMWRFLAGIGSVAGLTDGYPWGVWIAIDVVVGTALGCGGLAVGLLVYIFNKGRYHPLVRSAVLTSLLGYGLAVIAVTIDLGRFWGLWKVPTHVWRWTHSPQLEVALCVAAYVLVLIVEISPAFFEKWRTSENAALRAFAERGISTMERILVWVIALGLLLPVMHQSSLGTMMLLPATKLNPLWFTPWLPLFFLINCIIIGYAVVVLEATFSAVAFRRQRETAMLASLSKVAAGLSIFWVAFRVIEVAVAGEIGLLATGKGVWFLLEVILLLIGALILLSEQRRASPIWQVRAAMLILLGGCLHRINTYLVAFTPGDNWSYFPRLPELLITFGIIAAELAIYIAIVKTFPILGGAAKSPVRR